MSSKPVTNQRGITLTELLIALALGLFTVGAVYAVHLNQVKRQIVQEDVLAMQQTARAALDMMTREIRMAGYDPMGVNRDDDSTSTLRRKVGGGGRQPVAEHIEAVTFSYRDASGHSTTHAPSIRAVDVQVTARSAHPDSHYPENEGYRTLTLRSRIVPRNLQ